MPAVSTVNKHSVTRENMTKSAYDKVVHFHSHTLRMSDMMDGRVKELEDFRGMGMR